MAPPEENRSKGKDGASQAGSPPVSLGMRLGAIDVNVSHAPQLLIFTLTDWPPLEEQDQLLRRLVETGKLSSHTCALIDCRAVSPRSGSAPEARRIAPILQYSLAPSRRAYVLNGISANPILSSLEAVAPKTWVRAFIDERAALAWLLNQEVTRDGT